MGKRKSRKQPVVTKAKRKLPTLFNCPFCNSDKSVSVTTDKERSTGTCTCGVCGARYCGTVNSLSDPVDVYCEWIDACEDANAK
ncbi:hypothetical protein BSKO_07805 [Bryopsis sp. KO-2023]|nr:hypothetical protein BSKO_07805 [Bryopsis sp. KO-2023]